MHITDLDLEDLLADPLVRLVMKSDGVEEAHIRDLALRISPRSATDETRRDDRFDAERSALRHTPSCRMSWKGGSVSSPFI